MWRDEFLRSLSTGPSLLPPLTVIAQVVRVHSMRALGLELRQHGRPEHGCAHHDRPVLVHNNSTNIQPNMTVGADTENVRLHIGPVVRPTQGPDVRTLA